MADTPALSQVMAFKDLLESRRCDQAARDRLQEILSQGHIYGRVMQADPQNFVHLHPDTWKRFTFVFGPESLDAFLGKTGREITAHLEMPDTWIDQELERGHVFKMALFAPGAGFDVERATWEGLEAMVCKCYPEESEKVRARLPEIIQISDESGIAGFDDLGGYSMREVGESGRTVSNVRSAPAFYHYWTAAGAQRHARCGSEQQPVRAGCHVTKVQMQMLEEQGLDVAALVQEGDLEYLSCKVLGEVAGTVVEVRQWLWDQVGLNQDYTGTGLTKGARGTPEYFAVNCPLESLPGLALVDLQV